MSANGWELANRRLKATRLARRLLDETNDDAEAAGFRARMMDRPDWDEMAAEVGVNPPSDETVKWVVGALDLMARTQGASK